MSTSTSCKNKSKESLSIMYHCCITSLLFWTVGVVQYVQWQFIARFIATSLFATTSLFYHSLCNKYPEHRYTQCAYMVDQVFIWPCGVVILSLDYRLNILTLVCCAVMAHFCLRPLTDREHCLYVHVPILAAMLIQTP